MDASDSSKGEYGYVNLAAKGGGKPIVIRQDAHKTQAEESTTDTLGLKSIKSELLSDDDGFQHRRLAQKISAVDLQDEVPSVSMDKSMPFCSTQPSDDYQWIYFLKKSNVTCNMQGLKTPSREMYLPAPVSIDQPSEAMDVSCNEPMDLTYKPYDQSASNSSTLIGQNLSHANDCTSQFSTSADCLGTPEPRKMSARDPEFIVPANQVPENAEEIPSVPKGNIPNLNSLLKQKAANPPVESGHFNQSPNLLSLLSTNDIRKLDHDKIMSDLKAKVSNRSSANQCARSVSEGRKINCKQTADKRELIYHNRKIRQGPHLESFVCDEEPLNQFGYIKERVDLLQQESYCTQPVTSIITSTITSYSDNINTYPSSTVCTSVNAITSGPICSEEHVGLLQQESYCTQPVTSTITSHSANINTYPSSTVCTSVNAITCGPICSEEHVGLLQQESYCTQPVTSIITSTITSYSANINTYPNGTVCTSVNTITSGPICSGMKRRLSVKDELSEIEMKKSRTELEVARIKLEIAQTELEVVEQRKSDEKEINDLKKQLLKTQIGHVHQNPLYTYSGI